MDPNEYLNENFDISKLTVPKIRSILVEHQIEYPSNSNKSELIKIFNDKIVPKKDEILKQYSVLPSAEGIVDASSKLPSSEPIDLTDTDKTIPAKRSSDSSLTNSKKTKKKTSKKESKSASANSSYLGIDVDLDEINEIFDVPIKAPGSATPLKTSTKKIIEKNYTNSSFNDSKSPTPKVKRTKSPSTTTSAKSNSINLSEDKAQNNIEFIESINNSIVINLDDDSDEDSKDVFNISTSKTSKSIQPLTTPEKKIIDDIFTSAKILNGPIKNLKSDDNDSISIESDTVNEQVDDYVKTNKDRSEIGSDSGKKQQEANESEKKEDKLETKEVEDNEDENLNSNSSTPEPLKVEEIKEITKVIINGESESEVEEPIENTSKTISDYIINVILIFNMIVPIFLLYFFREIKINTGYCDQQSPEKLLDIWNMIPDSFHDTLLPIQPYIENFEDLLIKSASFECEPCPEHATCTSSSINCDYNYIKKIPLDSIFGLIPLQEVCQFDLLRKERMYYFTEFTKNYLHKHKNGVLSLEELHEYLKLTKPSTMNEKEFENLWNNFVKNELVTDTELNFNYETSEVTLSHKTPTEFYTRSFNNINTVKKSTKLFQKTPPSVDVKGYYTKRE